MYTCIIADLNNPCFLFFFFGEDESDREHTQYALGFIPHFPRHRWFDLHKGIFGQGIDRVGRLKKPATTGIRLHGVVWTNHRRPMEIQ